MTIFDGQPVIEKGQIVGFIHAVAFPIGIPLLLLSLMPLVWLWHKANSSMLVASGHP